MSAWVDWQAGPASCVALAILGAAAVLSWRFYGRAGRAVSPRRARVLSVLRLLTLALLALTVLRPTLWSVDPRPRPLHIVLDNSASMAAADTSRSAEDSARVAAALNDRAEKVPYLSRFDLALSTAHALASGPAAAGGVIVTTLDGRTVDLNDPPAPSAAATPLTRALHDATAAAASTGDDAVVLISDGRSTEFRSRPAVAGAAVFAVAVAPEDRTPAVHVTRIEARHVVLAGQSVPLRVRLSQRNAAGLTTRVTVDDGHVAVSRDVTLGTLDTTTELVWPAASAPGLRLTARAALVVAATGRSTKQPSGPSRNGGPSASADVIVVPSRERVLLLAGPTGGRDIAGLADALAAAPWIDLKRPPLAARQATTLPADAFAATDLIVLADLPPDALDDTAWDALTRVLRDGGRSLLVLAGRGSWLAEPAVARHLAGLLPTGTGPQPRWVTPPAEQGVWPVPTRVGGEASFLRLDESADASFRAWLARPRMTRLLDAGPAAAAVRTLLVDRTTQAPVLIEAAVGRGRVTMLLVDELWRWPIPANADPPQRPLWQGLARAMYDLPYDVSAAGLSLALDRSEAVAGEPVNVRVRAEDPAAAALSLSVTRDGVVFDTPALREVLANSGRATAIVTLPPGDYDLNLRQADRALHTALRVTASARSEEDDLTADPALLRGLAESTGGASVPLEQFAELPQLIVAYRREHPHTRSLPLWCSPFWFAAIVAAMGLEWALRADAGLA